MTHFAKPLHALLTTSKVTWTNTLFVVYSIIHFLSSDLTCTGHGVQKAREIYDDPNKNYDKGAKTAVWLITDGGIRCHNSTTDKKRKQKAKAHAKEMEKMNEVGTYLKGQNVEVR